jgi:hypothetical protein
MKIHRNNRLLILTVFVVAIVAAVFFAWQHLSRSVHRINPYTAMKVRLGMTQAQVEAIFGAPAGDYASGAKAGQRRAPSDRRPDLRREDWTADEGGAVVYFGQDGKVADATLWLVPHKASQFETIRKWWYWATVW